MIFFVLLCLLIFIACFALLVLRAVKVKDSYTGRVRFNFQGVHRILPSKFIWSFIGMFIIIYCASILLPIGWMFLNAVKGDIDFELNSYGFPREWMFENFLIVLDRFQIKEGARSYGIVDMLFNSIIYSCGNPLVTLFWVYSMAYVMSRFKWFGGRVLYALGVLLMMVSITGSSASTMIIYQKIGLYDNLYLNIILPPSTAFSGMYFMIIYGACKAISMNYSEAAYIDGANEYRVMYTIILPMVLPTLCTIYVLTFLSLWNNYSSFLVWYPSTPNLAYGLYRFQFLNAGSEGLSTPQILAGMFMVMIPSVLLYLATQKIMKSNFVVGGLKG